MSIARGLALKASGFRSAGGKAGKLGIEVKLPPAQLAKLEDVRVTLAQTGKDVRSGSRAVAMGLGAVGLGLAINALAQTKRWP